MFSGSGVGQLLYNSPETTTSRLVVGDDIHSVMSMDSGNHSKPQVDLRLVKGSKPGT